MGNGNEMRVLVVGATGLVGQGVLQACLQSADVGHVAALVRRPGSVPGNVDELVLADFQRAATLGDALAGFDACFYCAGAPPVGTAEPEYRQVTLQVTRAVAEAWAAANPGGCFLYVSGAHANPHSRFMPLRVKGETEQALADLPVRTVMLRPAGVRPVSGTALARMPSPPAVVECAQINALARDPSAR